MTWPWRKRPQLPEAADGQLVGFSGGQVFRLESGHPMRAGRCVLCGQWAGGQPVAIVGMLLLGGRPCSCGSLAAEIFLVHAAHTPVRARTLLQHVRQQVQDDHDHEWGQVR